ncbi:WD40/YVTN/BNR-like repeat-containing protein [Alkalihalobacterium elongatum]|uniref:WD40/YVTN/BNR-like repeat-containing protein n=1 Tax=Alkalihalobacterium elongatum TaxID=2675466 RepID=UPI001C1F486F|nr:hypothetical protein [Alkalihalobacterium elongatum]
MNMMNSAVQGATAVCKEKNGKYIVAIEREGIFRMKGLYLTKLFSFPFRIVKLTKVGSLLYGVGEKGVFLRSSDGGNTWSHKSLPTTSTIWSVVGSTYGMVITHGNNCLYFSYDFGLNWSSITPFEKLRRNSPAIRSLCLSGHSLFIGTKIHRQYGGVWKLDLNNLTMSWIKRENDFMVSCLIVHENQLLAAGGTCKGSKGKIQSCSLPKSHDEYFWNSVNQVSMQASFLDVSEDDGFIFATSSQDKEGNATVSRVYLEQNIIVPCNVVKGHGWRIANDQQDYVVAGHYELKHSTQAYYPNNKTANNNSNLS